jgi:hypothetical protein
MLNWMRINERNEVSAFGPDASHLLLHYRKDLDELVRNWHRQDKLNKILNQVQYVRNSHFLFDAEGCVRAAGHNVAHCLAYMQPGYVIVIRESLETEEQETALLEAGRG